MSDVPDRRPDSTGPQQDPNEPAPPRAQKVRSQDAEAARRRRTGAGAILSNALSSYARDGIEAVLFLILTPFIIHALGVEQYGLWSLLWAIISFFLLIDMGFGTSVVKFIADAQGKSDGDAHQRAVATLFWLYVGQAAILIGLVVTFATVFTDPFGIPAEWQTHARVALVILGVAAALGLPLAMFRGVLVGHQKQRVANGYKILASVLYFATTLVLLRLYPDLRVLAALNASALVLGYLATLVHTQLTVRHVSVHPRHFDRRLVRVLFGFSIFFALIHVSSVIATRVDAFVIHWALDLKAVAIYALAMRLSEKATQAGVQISRTLTPVVAELHGAGDEERIRLVWLRGSKMATAVAAPLFLGAALLARPLIVTWTSEEFAASATILQLLLAAGFVAVVHTNSLNLLSMRGEQRPLAFTLLGQQGGNLGLSILLVVPFGLVGVASATLVSALVVMAGVVMRRVCRQQRTSRWAFYRSTVLPSLAPAGFMTVGVVAWQLAHPVTSLLEVGLVEVGALAVFWVAFWRLGFDREERRWVQERAQRYLRRLRPQRAA